MVLLNCSAIWGRLLSWQLSQCKPNMPWRCPYSQLSFGVVVVAVRAAVQLRTIAGLDHVYQSPLCT